MYFYSCPIQLDLNQIETVIWWLVIKYKALKTSILWGPVCMYIRVFCLGWVLATDRIDNVIIYYLLTHENRPVIKDRLIHGFLH